MSATRVASSVSSNKQRDEQKANQSLYQTVVFDGFA